MSDLGLIMRHDGPDDPNGSGRRRRHGPRQGRRSAGLLAVLLGVPVVIIVVAALLIKGALTSPPDDYTGAGTGQVDVQVHTGDSLTAIGRTLQASDVVKTATAFVRAARNDAKATSVQPGWYRLRHKMSGQAALTLLLDPASRLTKRVTVPEGLRVSQALPRIAKASGVPLAELQKAAADPQALGLPADAGGKLEGYLFPATYDVDPGDTAVDVLKAMVTRYKQMASDVDLAAQAQKAGLTPHQVLTLASLVQAEGHPGDFAKIARVVRNRIAQGMPLQFDTTVLYAMGKSGTMSVSIADTRTPSPYNTYLHKGLPPGPIDNPGQAAVEAALHPADGPWLWFVTVDPNTGRTEFTDSYQTFLKLKREFQQSSGTG